MRRLIDAFARTHLAGTHAGKSKPSTHAPRRREGADAHSSTGRSSVLMPAPYLMPAPPHPRTCARWVLAWLPASWSEFIFRGSVGVGQVSSQTVSWRAVNTGRLVPSERMDVPVQACQRSERHLHAPPHAPTNLALSEHLARRTDTRRTCPTTLPTHPRSGPCQSTRPGAGAPPCGSARTSGT